MMTRRQLLITIVAVAGLGAASVAAQDDKPQVKVGVLPFVDATGTGGVDAGPVLSRLVQAEIIHSTQLFGRVLTLDSGRPEDVDVEKAAQLGKDAHVDIVLLGTVLEATSEESTKSGWTPSFGGQSVGGNVRRAKGKVTLQGDLVDTATGKRLASLRVKGEEADTHVGATVYSGLGSIGTDGNAWLQSPIGKATSKAVAELVKRMNVEAGKVKSSS
jgi:TolB-like protein